MLLFWATDSRDARIQGKSFKRDGLNLLLPRAHYRLRNPELSLTMSCASIGTCLNELFVHQIITLYRLDAERRYLYTAVDQDGDVLDTLAQR